MAQLFTDKFSSFEVSEDELAKMVNEDTTSGNDVVDTSEPDPRVESNVKRTSQSQVKGEIILQEDQDKWGDINDVINKEDKEKDDVLLGDDEDEDKETEKEVTPPDEPETEEEEEEVSEEQAAFNLAKELGTIQVPDDFKFDGTEEKLQEAIEITRNAYKETVEEEFYSQFKDPAIADIIKHAEEGGQFSNIPQYIYLKKQEEDFSKIDIDNQENAKWLVENHLKALGNSEYTIKKVIEDAEIEDKLPELAKEGQEYFVKTINKQKENLESTSRDQRLAQEKEVKDWEDSFMTALNKSPYSQEKRKELINSFGEVKIDEQISVPKYQYSFLTSQNNPEHFMQYLDFMNSYDPKEGFKFTPKGKTKDTEKNQTLLEKLKSGGKTPKSTTHQQGKTTPPMMNPLARNVQVV